MNYNKFLKNKWLLTIFAFAFVSVSEAMAATKADIQNKPSVRKSALPTNIEFELTNGGKTTLGDLMKGKKAVMIDFWATWCGPCMASMDELKHKASVLNPQGVEVIGMNLDSKAKAEKVRRKKGIDFKWACDPSRPRKNFYSSYFKVDTVPRVVLISESGDVLFNGHPQSPDLQKALSSLNVALD